MNGRHVVLALAGCAAAIVSMPAVSSPAFAQHKMGNMSDKQIIASALRAAPRSVAKGAAVVAVNPDGSMRVVREGKNGFTCLADNPATPGPDPMCGDKNAMDWAQAWIKHQTPPANKVGFLYMMEGGTDASNTDPYAEKPTSGNHWVKTGPARHGRRRVDDDGRLSPQRRPRHVKPLRDVGGHALRAPDDPDPVKSIA